MHKVMPQNAQDRIIHSQKASTISMSAITSMQACPASGVGLFVTKRLAS